MANKNKKVFSKTPANSSLAMCYVEECINEPDQKMYRYFHWDKRNRCYSRRTFIMDEAMLVNYLMYNKPDMLQKLLNDCTLYKYVMRRVRAYNKAVDSQTKELCKADREMQLALATDNMEKYWALENNNKLRAEETAKSILYTA